MLNNLLCININYIITILLPVSYKSGRHIAHIEAAA
jgi:hypothetical protein